MFNPLNSFLRIIHLAPKPLKEAPPPIPKFTFCEGICASSKSRWHIRRTKDKLFLSGGIDTPSLCGRIKEGWDLGVEIKGIHLLHSCPDCVRAYRERL